MHSLTFITALVSATAVASAGVPPHGHSFLTTHRPSTSTAPVATNGYTYSTSDSHTGRQTSSASDHITVGPTKVKVADAGPTSMTMTIINMAGIPVSTTHGHNPNAALPTIGMPPPAMMAPGAKHSYVLPLNFGGNLGVSKGKFLGDESLSEYSFELQKNTTVNKVSINVSYVTGFSLNINCVCSDGLYLSGCKELLWKNPELCKEKNSEGSCKNPLRKSGGPPADPFFLPCQHQAYAYVEDHDAQSNGECLTGDITCTILPGGN